MAKSLHEVLGWLHRDAAVIALGIAATAWYFWLFDPQNAFATSRLTLFLIGLWPVIAACVIALRASRLNFAPVACVAIPMIWALRSAVHPVSPDISFHAGKTLWAAAGKPLIDPVLGVVSGYPAAFHILWGFIARHTHTEPISLLRFASIFNLVGLWLVVWFVARRQNADKSVALYLTSLVLFTKDISEILLASPGSFSMPFAVLGWLLWAVATPNSSAILGALSLGLAIIVWPTHLFGAVGVFLADGWGKRRSFKGWSYFSSVVASLLIVVLVRSAVPGRESWSGLQLIPLEMGEFAIGRLAAFSTLGTNAYGLIPGLIASALLLIYLALSRIGWAIRQSDQRNLPRVTLGLLLGVLLAGWFMALAAHMVRLEFVALMVLLPLAANGISRIWKDQTWGTFGSSPGLWRVALVCIWLIPFLASTSASTERLAQWEFRTSPVTSYLAAHASSGGRVWASPDTYRAVILGRLPLFGFAAHRWPQYFAAPRVEAEALWAAYHRIYYAPTLDSARAELIRNGVDWIVFDKDRDLLPPWYSTSSQIAAFEVAFDSYVVYKITRAY